MYAGESAFAVCLDCGEQFDVVRERGFPLSEADAICPACAMRRGGVYDENEDKWETEPDVSDLRPLAESAEFGV